MNAKLKAALASYARSVLAAASALYLAGVTDPADLAKALLAGLLPVILRSLNKKDPAFGLVAKVADSYIAKLSNGEAVIPKEYLERNKAVLDELVKEATKASALTGPPIKANLVKGKAPAKKAPTKATAAKPAAKKAAPKK